MKSRFTLNDPAFNLSLTALIRFLREEFVRVRYFFQNLRKDGNNFDLDADVNVTGALSAASIDAPALGTATTEAVQDLVALLMTAGANISVTYNDSTPTLTLALSGTVPVGNGGTGLSTVASGDVLYASALNTLASLAAGASGTVLHGGASPSWGQVVNADVANTAAIAWTKLSKSGSSLADMATRSAGDLSSGTLLSARVSGAYTGITSVGTLTSSFAVSVATASSNSYTGQIAGVNAWKRLGGGTDMWFAADGTTVEVQMSRTQGTTTLALSGGMTVSLTFGVTGKLTAAGDFAHTGSKFGAFNITPVSRPSALVQTYSTSTRTLSAYTANTQSSAFLGAADGEAKLTDLNALRAAYENLRAFVENLAQHHNALVDDLQSMGLEA